MYIFSRIIKLCRTGLILSHPMLFLSGCTAGFQDCYQYAGTEKYTECLASNGDQEAQYQLGLAAYQARNMDTAIKWLKKASKINRERMTLYTNSDVAETLETGNYEPGHKGAINLLEKILKEEAQNQNVY